MPVTFDGLLFFPVTPCDEEERLDLEVFRRHVRQGVEAGCGAVFACCGTGEFPSLSLRDYAACVAAAVEEAAGRVPVVAGTGYGTAMALEFARAAEDGGASALLALPPYLVQAGQHGLRRHYEAIADGTRLPVILYQRDNAVFEPETVAALAEHPGVIGLKDGYGDLGLMRRIIEAAPPSMLYFNGLPTAELSQAGYRDLGVVRYSSAVFCFLPGLALACYEALRDGRDDVANRLIEGFYRPLVDLRGEGPGYAVSLIKAGVRLRGLDVGPVRRPLSDPSPEHIDRLAALIDRGLALLDELERSPDPA